MSDKIRKEIKNRLDYNPQTGVFTWRISPAPNITVGQKAGYLNTFVSESGKKKQYIAITVHNKPYRAHRLAWLYMTGDWPYPEVDHIDGNTLNNRWSNLRQATISMNQRNAARSQRNTSGRTGVCWNKRSNKWVAQIKVNGKRIYLGTYRNFDAAVTARQQAERKYGFHENHGRFLEDSDQ